MITVTTVYHHTICSLYVSWGRQRETVLFVNWVQYHVNDISVYTTRMWQNECCGLENANDWDANTNFTCHNPESRLSCGVPDSCCKDMYDVCHLLMFQFIYVSLNMKLQIGYIHCKKTTATLSVVGVGPTTGRASLWCPNRVNPTNSASTTSSPRLPYQHLQQ